MTNPSKSKGTAFETDVTEYLNDAGLHAERTGSALLDEGDVHFGFMPDEGEWTIEAKDHAAIDLPGYLAQLEASLVRRDGIPFKGAVVVKHRRKGVSESYAVMRLERYRQLAAYVITLEGIVGELTHRQLTVPSTTKEYLGALTAHAEPLWSVFAEFAVADDDQAPADDADSCGNCGMVHTPEEIAEMIEFMKLMTGVSSIADITDYAAVQLDSGPVLTAPDADAAEGALSALDDWSCGEGDCPICVTDDDGTDVPAVTVDA